MQKYQWLPEAHTDFIFAIIGEELGLVGTVSVILAFTLLLWRGVRASLRAPDAYGALLAGGITAWIGIQAFVNIGAVTGVIPTTGIPLPVHQLRRHLAGDDAGRRRASSATCRRRAGARG